MNVIKNRPNFFVLSSQAGNRVAVLRHSRVTTRIKNCFGIAIGPEIFYKIKFKSCANKKQDIIIGRNINKKKQTIKGLFKY